MKLINNMLFGTICALAATGTQAAVVAYSFSGTINSVNPAAFGFLPSLSGVTVGDAFSGTLTYESATSPSSNQFGGVFASAAFYQPSSFSFSVTIDGVTFNSLTGTHSAFIWNDEVTVGGCCNDGLLFTNITSANNAQYQLGNMLLPINILGTDALPQTHIGGTYVFDLRSAGASTAWLTGIGQLQQSTVPLPGAAWLFSAGTLALLAAVRRSR